MAWTQSPCTVGGPLLGASGCLCNLRSGRQGQFISKICGDLRERSLEKGMETHPSIPAWRISWTEEPGGPLSTGSQRVLHD